MSISYKLLTFIKKNIRSYKVPGLIFLLAFSIYYSLTFNLVQGDAVSMYYPAKMLLEKNDLNYWNSFNNKYNTYYFMQTFSDVVIKEWGEIYPIQPPLLILISATFIGIFGDQGFFVMPAFFSALSIVFTYLTVLEMHRSRLVALLSAIILFTLPLFNIWAVNVQNISIATSFFVISIYFLQHFFNSNKKIDLLFSGLFISLSVMVKMSHVLFYLAFIPLLYLNFKHTLFFRIKYIGIFILPLVIQIFLTMIFNLIYFDDLFFIGYLSNNFHPLPPDYIYKDLEIPDSYLLKNINISKQFDSLVFFFKGTSIQYFPLVFISIIGIVKNISNKINIFCIISLIIYLFYYGKIAPNLWMDFRDEYKWSLTLAFFRYLLPIYILLNLSLSNVIFSIIKNIRIKVKISFVLLLLVIYSTFSFIGSFKNYFGGDLNYFNELNNKVSIYNLQITSVLSKNSVILYDERWGFAYTYPFTEEYTWFYYDGVPPQVRYSHTKKVVKKLLEDNVPVYFIHQDYPYDKLSAPMEDFLKKNFELNKVNGSDFPRMKTYFYQVL